MYLFVERVCSVRLISLVADLSIPIEFSVLYLNMMAFPWVS